MSAPAAARAKAAQIVVEVSTRGRSLDSALSFDGDFTLQDRGLIRSLCYETLRWYWRLEAMLNLMLPPGRRAPQPQVKALALLGMCQLLHTDIPPHAAVAETVGAAQLMGLAHARGFVNAILRRCQRERAMLSVQVDRNLATRTAHPTWLVEALKTDWGPRAEAILAANNEHPPFWIRVNRLLSSGAEYRARLAEQGIAVAASRFDGETLLLSQALDVAQLPGFEQGAVSVQDAAAQLAARLLAPRRGERVLDACAAPGGKTGHLLELQPQLAELLAVDISQQRLARVGDNLRRLGLNATLISGDAADPGRWWDGVPFQRILLDVPCSATGVIRRHPDIKLLRRSQDIPALAARQLQLLERLWPLLAPGGRLLYASCSALRAETTAVVGTFLAASPQARDVTEQALAALGCPAQPDSGPGHRIAAGTAGMDGFYYACLEKSQRTVSASEPAIS